MGMSGEPLTLEVPRWVRPLLVLTLLFTEWAALYINGLITSTALALFDIPVVLSLVDDAQRWLSARRSLPTHRIAAPRAGLENP